MAKIDLPYARALWAAAPLGDLARAVWRRARPRREAAIRQPDRETRERAADALGRAPGLLAPEPLGDAYFALFPDGAVRLAARAERILEHEIELFGRRCKLGRRIDWIADPLDGALGGDPKGAWELQRSGWLVELGAAARLHARLRQPARDELRAAIEGFLDQCPTGEGPAYASSLEVALRAIHWLGALELCGGARAFPRSFVERLGGALLLDAQFLAAHLEDSGVAPANHLLGDLAGLYVLGHALDGAPGAQRFVELGRRGLEREAARQVGPDGAHFEASTAYHRFALELLLVAHRAARARGATLAVGETLHRMLGYLRGTLQPDGTEPGFGDSDDARLFPIVPRAPRDHAYLLSIGVALFGDPALKPPATPFAEEALWWLGPGAHRAWQWVPASPDLPSSSFPSGGVHLLRDRDLYVALRAGSYGQKGVGGHAHNDQLGVVIHVAGAPLVIDPGTGCYTADPLMRDRFRSTAAHATVTIEGAEQSPILDGRPFALPDRARASRVLLEELGGSARLSAAHTGYLRLPARVCHRRTLTLVRDARVLLVDDQLDGRGAGTVELRFPLAADARLFAGAATLARLERLRALLGPVDPRRIVELSGGVVLVAIGVAPLEVRLDTAACALRYGQIARRPLVAIGGLLTFPCTVSHAFVFGPGQTR
jgi:hypothetical protein